MDRPSPPPVSETQTPWTPAARQAAAFVLGIAVTLVGIRVFSFVSPARPTDRISQALPAYRVDLNHANAAELEQLPGIGPQRAKRIADVRNANGPFASVEDLAIVPGLGPSTIDRVRPHVQPGSQASATTIHTSAKSLAGTAIDINTATAEQLQTLPGIGPKLAQRIIDQRSRQPFRVIDDLRHVGGIGPKTLDKLRGLVKFDNGETLQK